MKRFKYVLKNKLDRLPKTAGVYLFYDLPAGRQEKSPIYIGKAINIRNRVKNHFNPGAAFKDNILSKLTTKIGFLKTGSEIEALILEASLIKKHQPKYNVIWKDDKNYFYVAIAKNKQKIPYIYITHQPRISSLRGRSEATDEAISKSRLLRRQRAPRNDTFVGPFVEGTALKKTLRFLRKAFPYYTSAKHPKTKCTWCHLDLCPGPYEKLFSPSASLRASSKLSEYKKNIKKLILILKGKKTRVLKSLKFEMQTASKEKKFEEAGKIKDRMQALEQIMAHTHVINGNDEIYGFLPRGKKPYFPASQILGKIIGLEKEIYKIEAYDVSNIQGKFATASMVVFINGAPDKSQYKKFKIKMENKPNDIAMLKETLERRLLHKEWPYPDVMLIDGGKAQLNVAINSKIQNIKIISIAKGRQELFIEGKNPPAGGSIPLKSLPQEVYNLIKQLNDEAHRFAITYHKKLRKKNLIG